jgi:hypothetical protein
MEDDGTILVCALIRHSTFFHGFVGSDPRRKDGILDKGTQGTSTSMYCSVHLVIPSKDGHISYKNSISYHQ